MSSIFFAIAVIGAGVALGSYVWLAASRHEGFSFYGVARLIRVQGWCTALPGLLVAAGMLTSLVFVALALLASLPSKLFGMLAFGIAAYVVITELRSFWRGLRG